MTTTLGAPERRLLNRRRRARRAEPGPAPEPVSTARVTVVDPNALAGADQAAAWLQAVDADAEVDAALRVIDAAVQAHRIAAGDPTVRAPGRTHALVTRIGYGIGEQVAQGHWVAALTLPARPGPGHRARRDGRGLGAQERYSALLSGRDVALAAETLTLDARRELDGGRLREAALLLRVALEAALAELVPWTEHHDVAGRLPPLRAHREPVVDAANAALRGGLDDTQVAAIGEALRAVEAALRARAAAVGGLRP